MCGSLRLNATQEAMERIYGLRSPEIPRGFVSYGSRIGIVALDRTGTRRFAAVEWGSMVETKQHGRAISYNARIESLQAGENRTYAPGFQDGLRCIVPASDFYEKSPSLVRAKFSGPEEVMSLAGVVARDRHGSYSVVVVTTEATPQVATHHNRMPLIIRNDCWEGWADPNMRGSQVSEILSDITEKRPLTVSI